MTTAVLVCAGKGERADFGFNKLLKETGGTPVFQKTLYAFSINPDVDEIIVVCAERDETAFNALAEKLGVKPTFVRGGDTRAKSVLCGVKAAAGDIVVVHDGARPFVSQRLISECIRSAAEYGSGVACVPAVDTIAITERGADGDYIVRASRAGVRNVQTPQAFDKATLLKAFALANDTETFTDESGLYAKYIGKCRVVAGETTNKKLTLPEDFAPSENLRAGTGFDLHRLVSGRKFVLGGVEIPHDKGLLGHSDADVLLHAIADALLSSVALGDIGRHFPDTDEKYAGISSAILYAEVLKMLKERGYEPLNISAVIMAQKPKLAPYVAAVTENVARLSGLSPDRVGITCTTLEGIGLVGREEGVAVQAYCLTVKTRDGK